MCLCRIGYEQLAKYVASPSLCQRAPTLISCRRAMSSGASPMRRVWGRRRSTCWTISIVAVDLESDPVASGLVSSLAHPGGNLTGFFLDLPEVNGKPLEQLKEAIPGVARVAILVDPTMDPAPRRAAEVAARLLGLSFQVVEARARAARAAR
jgi:hypothetical protein